MRRGNADAAKAVTAMRHWYHARRDRRGRPARRAARAVVGIPRIAAYAEVPTFGGSRNTEFRHVCSSEKNNAGCTVAAHEFAIAFGTMTGKKGRAVGHRPTC